MSRVQVKCKVCQKLTINKVYCSESCQYKGYSKSSRINICPVCGEEHKNKVHCSRKCYAITDSARKRELYSKIEHPRKGKLHTNSTKLKQSSSHKLLNQLTPEIVSRRRKSSKQTAIKNGYANGWSPSSRKKRKLKLSNLSGKYGERPCDITFMKKYGMTSVEYRRLKMRQSNETSIEKKVRLLLTKYNIKFKQEFLYKGHYFDFLLIDYNIIIECDGDYFHGYGILIENMDKIQYNTHLNDIKKTKFINQSEFKLIRFWEHEIREDEFEFKLKSIWER